MDEEGTAIVFRAEAERGENLVRRPGFEAIN